MAIEKIQNQLHEPEKKVHFPEVLVCSTPELVDRIAADRVIRQITDKPNSVLTLPTGSTPIGMYRLLCESYGRGEVDFSGITVYNLDEYCGDTSYADFMLKNLFRNVNIPRQNRHIPNGMAKDPVEETARYEKLIKSNPPDLAILGIGPGMTCHIGFNGPGTSCDSTVHVVDIDEETRDANAKFFEDQKIPDHAMTQGVLDILSAERVMLLAKGSGKAPGIRRTLQGKIGPTAPASYLRLHPNVSFIIDQEAASQLQGEYPVIESLRELPEYQ